MKKGIDSEMSDDSKNDLDKDDEDMEFETFNPNKEKFHPLKPRKPRKKSTEIYGCKTTFYSLFKKHSRSSNSSNSSNSNEKPKKINKKKKKELTSFQKSYIQSQKENFEKNYQILKDDFKLLEEYERKIFKDTNLDLMFIMDLTGSMGIWLEEAQKNIKNIIDEITDNNPGSKIRISFVGYRDFLDVNEKRNYNSLEFTEDINIIDQFISKLDCYGGGDLPEDIIGALQEALNMKWESNAKYAILVCDAPCHGRKYHSFSYDKFENGDPSGITLEETMKKFYDKEITFYCLEIDYSTEKMFKIMKEIYNDDNKFHIEKLMNSVNQFSFFVSFSASVLLGNSKYNKFKFKDIISNYRKETIEKIMKKYANNNNMPDNTENLTMDLINQIENMGLGGEDKKLFDFINRMNDLNINSNLTKQNNEDYIKINLDDDEFTLKSLNEKEINYNLKALSYNKSLNIVNDWTSPLNQERELKTQLIILYNNINKNIYASQYELKIFDKRLDKEKNGTIPFSIEKKFYNNPNLFVKNLSYNELICEQIGDYFNILLEEKISYSKQFIKFQKHILYEMNIIEKNKESTKLIDEKFYYNTKYIISEDSSSFQLNLSNPMSKTTLESFSHFSYQISGGQLLISILNYDKNIKKVTDFKIYFLKDNGYKNILEFFSSHICDNTCRALELVHPRKKRNPFEINEQFYSNKYLTDIKLCECCSLPITTPNNNDDATCQFCSCKEISTKYKATCIECKNEFFYSTYLFNSKLINYPQKCLKCNSNFCLK